jgi:quinol monooxygenase YgiN
MSTYVFVNKMQAKAGQQSDLIDLLRDFAVSMNVEPDRLHYSVQRAIDDPEGPVTVIQAFATREAVDAHGDWMSAQAPRLMALLEFPPDPPILLEQVELSGHPLESFGA